MENVTVNSTVELINFLFGVNIKIKELHWKTDNDIIHQQLGRLESKISYFLDSCAEIVLSLNSRDDLNTGSLQAEPIPVNEPHELISLINNRTIKFKTYIESLNDNNYAGLMSKIDDFISNINVIKYRLELK